MLKYLILFRSFLTSRKAAAASIEAIRDEYLALASGLDQEAGRQSVKVPKMLGVDEDMRDWSFFMLLEHNAIVNRAMSRMVNHLATGSELPDFNPKTDVMPSNEAGVEQVEVFRRTVEDHLSMVARLENLRGTPERKHPVFGMLNAHGWHCMFGLHLRVHLKQARLLAELQTTCRLSTS